jgi:hypothetical protein
MKNQPKADKADKDKKTGRASDDIFVMSCYRCDIFNYDTISMENRVTLFQPSGF